MTNATASINYAGLSVVERKWINREARLYMRCLVKNVKFMTLVFAGKWIKKERERKKNKKVKNDKIAITRTINTSS